MLLRKTSANENWEEVLAQANYHLYFQCKKSSLNFYLTESDFNSKVLSNPWICHNAFAAIFHLLRQIIEMTSNNRNLFILGDFNCHHPSWSSKGTSDSRVKEIFNFICSPDLLPLNDPHIPTLFHRSSGSRSFISFVPFSCPLLLLEGTLKLGF